MPDHHRHHLRHPRPGRNDLIVLLLAAIVGCAAPRSQTTPRQAPPAPAPAPTETLSAVDPCPQRLHDLSGGLLLYYFQNKKMPPNLSVLELPDGVAGAAEAVICPTSGEPYVYNPRGLPAPDGKSRLIVYDATPAHAGWRWAVSFTQVEAEQAQTDVIAVPESYFATPD